MILKSFGVRHEPIGKDGHLKGDDMKLYLVCSETRVLGVHKEKEHVNEHLEFGKLPGCSPLVAYEIEAKQL